MSPVLPAAVRLSSLLVGGFTSAPDDPFGPGGQDPDTARDLACELTVSDNVCSPPAPEPFVPSPPTSRGSTGGGALGNLLVLLLVVALVVCLVWLVYTVVRNRGAGRDAGDDEDGDVEDDLEVSVEPRVIDRERPPDTWRAAAAEHRAAGRSRDAIRCEYRALVGDLARAGIVDEIPGRTSGEERGQLAALAPRVAADFDRAADLFDGAWFGHIDVGPTDDEAFVTASRSVLDVALAGAGRRGLRGER